MERYKDTSLPSKERAESLLKLLNLREKVGQVNQHLYGFSCYTCENDTINLTQEFTDHVDYFSGLGMLYGLYRADPWSKKDFSNGLVGANAAKAYNKVQKYVIENSRFGIPALMSTECPHGHQALDGYLLPVNLAHGAAWNPTLSKEAFSVCGAQMAEMGVDLALISMLDVLRDPRWGRSEECYCEDPYLSSVLAKAVTEGCLSSGVDVVAKHFAAQGETTGGVNASAASIGERELRDIHLPSSKAAIDAGVIGFMAAYNEIDGIPCHANPWLLRTLLRDEFGFSGFVMADGCAIDRLTVLTGSDSANGALALKSGVDVSLWDKGFTMLEDAIDKGLVSEELLDEAVLRVLTLKFERGLFENPFMAEKPLTDFSIEGYPQTLELARQSAVLLKNDRVKSSNILPLNQDVIRTIVVIGSHATDIYAQLGDYTSVQRDGTVISLLDGMTQVSPKNIELRSMTEPIPTDENEMKLYMDNVRALASSCDIIILAVGGSSSRFGRVEFDSNGAAIMNSSENEPSVMDCGEGVDISKLTLPKWQNELLSAVSGLGIPVITVVLAGRPYVIGEFIKKSDALIYSFYPGPAGGQALAELIWGDISPSGRLPVSLPRSVGQLPVYYNYKTSYTAMTYADCPPDAEFSFGFGLNYSEVSLSEFQLKNGLISLSDLEKDNITLSFKIKNGGIMDAYATPQLFVKDIIADIVPRAKMLKAFDKIFIQAGEEVRCSLSLSSDSLKIWNREMNHVVEPGDFEISIFEGEKTWWRSNITIR